MYKIGLVSNASLPPPPSLPLSFSLWFLSLIYTLTDNYLDVLGAQRRKYDTHVNKWVRELMYKNVNTKIQLKIKIQSYINFPSYMSKDTRSYTHRKKNLPAFRRTQTHIHSFSHTHTQTHPPLPLSRPPPHFPPAGVYVKEHTCTATKRAAINVCDT